MNVLSNKGVQVVFNRKCFFDLVWLVSITFPPFYCNSDIFLLVLSRSNQDDDPQLARIWMMNLCVNGLGPTPKATQSQLNDAGACGPGRYGNDPGPGQQGDGHEKLKSGGPSDVNGQAFELF